MSRKWSGTLPARSSVRRRRLVASDYAEAAGQLSFQLDLPPIFESPAPLRHRRPVVRKAAVADQTDPDAAGRLSGQSTNPTPVSQQPTPRPQRSDAILKLPAVKAKTGLSRSTIYTMIDKKLFPAQIPLGPMSVGWSEEEIDAWVEERKRRRAQNG